MKRETLTGNIVRSVIRPEKHKRRIGVLPTYAQRDRTKYTRKAKHRGQDDRAGSIGGHHGKPIRFPGCFSPQRRISSVGRAIVS